MSDLALTLVVPAWYGWLFARTWVFCRRASRAEASVGRTLYASAGPFEGCRGRMRIFVASAENP